MTLKRAFSIAIAVTFIVGTLSPHAEADLWCAGVIAGHPQTIVCDDFDRYCTNPPAWPDRCVNQSTPDQEAFLTNWPEVADSGNPTKVNQDYKTSGDTLYAESPPFTVRYYSGSNPEAGNYYLDTQHSRDLRANIAALEPGRNIVNGTDEHPLILEFVYHFHDEGRQYYQSQYVDLSLDDGVTLDRAPTDYILSEDCAAVGGCGDSHGYPIICQQNNSYVLSGFCPPLESLPIHSSIAVGILSWLDTNPCHCGEDVAHAASNWHLVFFDGKQWWTLKSNLFPGGGTRTPLNGAPEPPPEECKIKSPGDFGLFNGLNHVRLTIKTNTVRVDHWYRQMCKTDNTKKYDIAHWAEIPRQYFGGFNNIALGTAKGCELDVDGNCLESRHLLGPNGHGGNAEMDSVALVDGVLDTYTAAGACCLADGTCTETDLYTCANVLQGRFAGANTTCATTLCCPIPFADGDVDGDVDQDDFGLWQLCFTNVNGGVPAGCECCNQDGDDDVDGDDFQLFHDCWTGPQVPWSPALTPACNGPMTVSAVP